MTRPPSVEVTTLTIHIPVQFKRRGGRRLILAPDGVTSPLSAPPAVDDAAPHMTGRGLRPPRTRRQV